MDLTTDTGFDMLKKIASEVTLDIPEDLDITVLLEKQAHAEDYTFADPVNRLYSIASKEETELSARYAEKTAGLSFDTIQNINEACYIYGVTPVQQTIPTKVANEMFPESEYVSEKYASCTEYGTELNSCLAARALISPDSAEELEGLAKLASDLSPYQMVEVLRQVDAELGFDHPNVQAKVGTPEYAVFEKRSSDILVDLGKKHVPFEKLAELGEAMDNLGITIDFDAEDPYTTKLAIERLPLSVRNTLASMV